MAVVTPSEELRAFLLRIYAAMEADDAETLRSMFSTGAYSLMIGTDPEEWWTRTDGIEIVLRQSRELRGVRLLPGEPVAYVQGDVGWLADRPRLVSQTGAEVQLRLTAVLAMERGHWRVVQWHNSIGEADETTFGRSLTKSIEAIEHSVRRDRPDFRPASAPDGTVTIAFTDIESSSVLLDRIGDAAFVRLLSWHDRIVRDAAEQQNGFVVKSQGDGFMLAFPSAAYALRSSVTMRNRIAEGFENLPVRIRVGLHSGETVKHSDDFYGRTVVIAARIGALAFGGEILASDLVYALARGLGTFAFGEPRKSTLKGLDGSFDLYPVIS